MYVCACMHGCVYIHDTFVFMYICMCVCVCVLCVVCVCVCVCVVYSHFSLYKSVLAVLMCTSPVTDTLYSCVHYSINTVQRFEPQGRCFINFLHYYTVDTWQLGWEPGSLTVNGSSPHLLPHLTLLSKVQAALKGWWFMANNAFFACPNMCVSVDLCVYFSITMCHALWFSPAACCHQQGSVCLHLTAQQLATQMCKQKHRHVHSCEYEHVHMSTPPCPCLCIYACEYVWIHTHTHTHTMYMNIRTHTYKNIMYVNIQTYKNDTYT